MAFLNRSGIEPFLLLALLPVALFPRLNILLAAGALLILFFWGARYHRERRFWPATPLNASLALLLLMVGVSLWATNDLAFSLGKVAGLCYGIALFLALTDLLGRSPKLWHFGGAALLLSSLGVIGLGILGTQWSSKIPLLGPVATLFNRLRALFPPLPLDDFNPNQIGGVLLWIAPAALAVTIALLRRPRRLSGLTRLPPLLLLPLVAAVTLLNYVMLLLTQSRSTWLGLLFALALMGWLVASFSWRRILLAGGGLVVIGLLLAAVLNSSPAASGGFLAGLGLRQDALFDTSGTGLGSLNGRLEIWSRALYGIEDFPLTGMGMNNFRRVVHILYPLFTISPDVDVAHAHNHLLQTALDLGLPGLIAYLALWWGAAAMLWRTWRTTADPWARALVTGFSGSLLGFWVYGLTDAVALGAKPGFIFWLLLACVTALHELVRQGEWENGERGTGNGERVDAGS